MDTPHLGVSDLRRLHGEGKRCCMSSVVKMEAMKQLNRLLPSECLEVWECDRCDTRELF